MTRFLPFFFLASTAAVFGTLWIVFEVDPDFAPWYIFLAVILLIFVATFGFLGLILYFVRTKLYRRYSANWYFYTSFKMAFFISLFLGLVATLAVFQQVSTLNIALAIVAVALFAFWSYLGKRG